MVLLEIDFVATTISYTNEFGALGNAPAAATYPGYFFTVDGDDNPYVNINITAGGVGDTRAALLTQYSGIDALSDVDTTTAAPTANQVLKWNGTNWTPADDGAGRWCTQNLFATSCWRYWFHYCKRCSRYSHNCWWY